MVGWDDILAGVICGAIEQAYIVGIWWWYILVVRKRVVLEIGFFRWLDGLVVNEILDVMLKADAMISPMTRSLEIGTMFVRVKVKTMWWLGFKRLVVPLLDQGGKSLSWGHIDWVEVTARARVSECEGGGAMERVLWGDSISGVDGVSFGTAAVRESFAGLG